MKTELIPAILTRSKRTLENRLKKVKGLVKTVQIDIMDGKFVKNKSINPSDIKTRLKYDLHLMVRDPFLYIDYFSKANRIIFHYEAVKNKKEIYKLIKAIKNRKGKVGIAINPETKIEKIKPYLKDIDLVLVMTVKPGASGQKFKKSMLEKVRQIRKWSKVEIGVDGGVNEKNYIDCIAAGVNMICMASAIYTKKDIKKFITKIKKVL